MRSLNAVYANAQRVLGALCTIFLITNTAIFTSLAHGQWQDPLTTPAMKTNKAPFSLLLDVAAAGDNLVAVGAHGHIIISEDEGRSWKQASVPVMTTLTAVYFTTPKYGWAVGHDAVVLNTVDGGKTWNKQFDGFLANEKVLIQAKEAVKKAEAQVSTAEVMGNNQRKADAEAILEEKTFALEDAQYDFDDKSTKPLLDVWFKNRREGFVVGAYGMIFKTMDGGQSWVDWSEHVENPERLHLNAIAHVGGERLMIAGEVGILLRSSNGGELFEKTFSPYKGSFFGILSLDNNQVQVAFGLRGNLAMTTNFGSNWKLQDTKTQQSLMGGIVNQDRVLYLVGNGGSFTKGLDQGRKWVSMVRNGRNAVAGIIGTKSGHLVIVGEHGVELLEKSGKYIKNAVSSVEG